MSALQQIPAINAQFVRQMLRWGGLRNPAQDEDNRGTAVGKERDGEQIEDHARSSTALVQDQRVMPIMGSLIGRQSTILWTRQAVGM
jgi:hypothetical protein